MIFNVRLSSGVDFDELLRKAAARKRAELQDERLKKQEVSPHCSNYSNIINIA